jgi:hypothetical protein
VKGYGGKDPALAKKSKGAGATQAKRSHQDFGASILACGRKRNRVLYIW